MLHLSICCDVRYDIRIKNDVRFVFISSCLWEGSCLIYVICVCFRIVVSNTYCVDYKYIKIIHIFSKFSIVWYMTSFSLQICHVKSVTQENLIHNSYVVKYIQKCSELCWRMQITDPPLCLKFDVISQIETPVSYYLKWLICCSRNSC
jgi:hypothetical protein